MATSSPWSRAVFDVIGPILATCIWAGHGNPSAMKFSTVDELVNVIKSAPSSNKRRRAPVSSRVSGTVRSEEHTSELQSQSNLVCRLLLEKKKKIYIKAIN